MKILVVEDDRVSGLKLCRALEKMGHSVEIVGDGAAAWQRLCDDPIGLLISDWEMPEMDGLELCRRIRGRADSLYTYIVLLTARDSREDRLAGLQAGADDFLTKPLDTGELVARLNIARRILAMQEELHAHAAQLSELHAALERQNLLLEQQNVRLAERAATDGLTGLNNRRQFDEALRSALSFARRHDHRVSLVLLDVDHFKSFNDTFGHPAGDEVLRAVADALQSQARVHDIVARYGGEEFALVLPATDAGGARVLAERIRTALASRPWPLRPVTASLGVATTTVVVHEADDLVAEADRALYASKARGRDRVTHHVDLEPAPRRDFNGVRAHGSSGNPEEDGDLPERQKQEAGQEHRDGECEHPGQRDVANSLPLEA
jgi:diguanylate cyclase (GGDEF)-like protein